MHNDSPDFLGDFEIDVEVTTIKAEERPLLLNWTAKEYVGTEIYRYFDGWVDKCNELSENEEIFAMLDKHQMNSFDDISIGDTVIIPDLFGIGEAKITEINKDSSSAAARTGTGNSLYLLDFGKDDRNAWVSSCHVNEKALANVRFDNEE